jgi:preprotein translocase subunit SecG
MNWIERYLPAIVAVLAIIFILVILGLAARNNQRFETACAKLEGTVVYDGRQQICLHKGISK